MIGALPSAEDYTEVKIPKKRGGYRTLFVPSPELKRIQRRILRFLRKIFRSRYTSTYGLHSGSYIQHARYHSTARFILQFDLKNAFPSVNISQLRTILLEKFLEFADGLFPKVELVKLLETAEEFTDLVIKLTTYNSALPQGAPTSPFLFYIMLTKNYSEEDGLIDGLIRELIYLCPSGWKMSCYVDSFIVSGQKPLPPDIKEKMLKIIEEAGFEVNKKKTWLRDCRNGAPLITGIRVDGKGRISLPKKAIKKWRGIIHRAAFETNSFAKEYLIRKIEGFIASLKPIYGNELPPQIKKPYLAFKKNEPA